MGLPCQAEALPSPLPARGGDLSGSRGDKWGGQPPVCMGVGWGRDVVQGSGYVAQGFQGILLLSNEILSTNLEAATFRCFYLSVR